LSKTILFIAISLDGYIARIDGDIDWLTSIPNPDQGDYGYANLINSIGTIIMGRKTYESILGFGIPWPYEEFTTYIVTENSGYTVQSPNTFTLTHHVKEYVTQLQQDSNKDIWIVGGSSLVRTLLSLDLIDKMIISIIPTMIGEGIPLFLPNSISRDWNLVETKQFNTGVVNLIYEK
jgi:dihydrofolate reductase